MQGFKLLSGFTCFRFSSISAFVSLVWCFFTYCKFCSRIKICEITAGMKKRKSIIKKKKKHHKTSLLAKTKVDTIDFLISKALLDSYINHDEFVSVSNVLKKFNEMKKEIKNPKNTVEHILYKSSGDLLCQF